MLRWLLVFCWFALPFCELNAAEVAVRVVRITDGDTVGVIDSQKHYFKVRLLSIDAPEMKQAYGRKSREALAEKIFGDDVLLDTAGEDRYGRTLATIMFKGRNINLEMVAEGWAWQYVQYDMSAEFREAEKVARRERRGLWADQQEPEAPWDFRHRQKDAAAPAGNR